MSATNTNQDARIEADVPLSRQPAALRGALVALRFAQVLSAFTILVPAGIGADMARNAQAAANSVNDLFSSLAAGPGKPGSTGSTGGPALPPDFNQLLQQGMQQLQALGGSGTTGGAGRKLLATSVMWQAATSAMAFYIIVLLFGLITLFSSALWMFYTLKPERRYKCAKPFICELALDAILIGFWFAAMVVAGIFGVWTVEGAVAVLAAVLLALLSLSLAATVLLRKALGPNAPVAPEAAAAPAATGNSKEVDIEAGKGAAPKEVPAEEGSPAAAPAVPASIELVTEEPKTAESK